ncbi:hypothetical protein D3C71_579670 [compost metagenome]
MPFGGPLIDQRLFFVSSWVRGGRGEAGMWYRYGDADRGVRIELPEVRFPWTVLNETVTRPTGRLGAHGRPELEGLRIHGAEAPYGPGTLFGNGFIALPFGADMRGNFGADVLYADDPVAEVGRRVVVSASGLTINGDGTYVARVKGMGWADQAEHRFVLSAFKGPAMDYASNPAGYADALLDSVGAAAALNFSGFTPDVRFIDLPLAENAFDGLVVTTGPAMLESNRDALERRVKALVPSAKFERSALRVRSRS